MTLAAYRRATRREAELRRRANVEARLRAAAVADMHRAGVSYRQIADLVGLSRSAVQQLAERGRSRARSRALTES